MSCKKVSRAKLVQQFQDGWNCMMEIRAVKWDKSDKRWTKVTPSRSTIVYLKAQPEDLRASLLILPHADIFADFARQQGTDFMRTSIVSTLSLPTKLEEFAQRYLREQVVELVDNLVISCSPADMAELKKMDEDAWKAAKEFRKQFAEELGMYAEDPPRGFRRRFPDRAGHQAVDVMIDSAWAGSVFCVRLVNSQFLSPPFLFVGRGGSALPASQQLGVNPQSPAAHSASR